MMFALLVLSTATLAYVYVGYPVLLRLLVRLRGVRPVRIADITPSLTFVISAYNEGHVIRRKLENTLSLNYPPEALQVVVISDASSDDTDAIVTGFADSRVRLVRQPTRRGKTAGLNRTLPLLTTELVVFSDANAIYERDALLKLARNFADPDVGCVTGEARYLEHGPTVADVGERVYWSYEMQIKRRETALGSMVGGDGAIYGIRRTLWRELPEDAINDFLNPLQIVAAGWRAVYEPQAVCYEETAGGIGREYRRRVRIVSRSWRAVFQASGALNPFRVGFFAWSLVSHKMLRWLSGVIATLAIVSGTAVFMGVVASAPALTLGIVALSGAALVCSRAGRRMVAMLAYFATIYAASTVGIVKGSLGHVSGIWATPRQDEAAAPPPGPLVPVGILLHVAIAVLIVAGAALTLVSSTGQLARIAFWASSALLAYVYVIYPVVLAVMRLFAGQPVHRAVIEPSVCVFIAANDEEEVISAKLHNTLALDYPAHQLDVVVASDGSVDATNDIVRRFAPKVRLLPLSPRRGKIAAIIEGIKTVESDIVVFSDANTFLQPDAVRVLMQNFADPQVGAVSGDVALIGERASLAQSEDLYYRYERWLQNAESEIGSMIGADGALYAIRRTLFVPPPADTILDDMAIPMAVIRAGKRVVYDGRARALEQGSETARQEFARKCRVIAGATQFLRRRDSTIPLSAGQVIVSLVSHKALRWLSPAFVACAFLSSVVLVNQSPIYATAAGGLLLLTTLGLAGCAPALRRISVVAVAHYFCLVQLAAVVGFLRGMFGRQSVLWRRFERPHSSMAYTHD